MTAVNVETGELVETLSAEDARRLTDRIRLLAASVADSLDKMAALIDAARLGSAWITLGYRSWTDYVSTEFAGVLPRLDRQPRQDFVRELSSRGMSTRTIAPIVQVHHDTVASDIKSGVGIPTREAHASPQTSESAAGGEASTGSGQTPEGASQDVGASEPPTLVPSASAPRPPVIGRDGKTYAASSPRQVQRDDAEVLLNLVRSLADQAARKANTLTPAQIARVKPKADLWTVGLGESLETLQRLLTSLTEEK